MSQLARAERLLFLAATSNDASTRKYDLIRQAAIQYAYFALRDQGGSSESVLKPCDHCPAPAIHAEENLAEGNSFWCDAHMPLTGPSHFERCKTDCEKLCCGSSR